VRKNARGERVFGNQPVLPCAAALRSKDGESGSGLVAGKSY
jgi:hypothetical protein